MKKLMAFMLAAALALSLAACGGKSEAAKAVDQMISEIGEVTVNSGGHISAAEEAVAALDEEDRQQLENLDSLEKARETCDSLILESEADKIEEVISAIGTVTLDSGDAISAAANAYGSAAPEVQALVKNAADLEAASLALNSLRVSEVSDMIDAIGTVTLESGESIDAAKAAFDALPASLQGQVGNASSLEAAGTSLRELKEAMAQTLLADMRMEEDMVRGMRFYYSKAQPIYADDRCFVLPYLGQQGDNTWLCAQYHYTEDDWIFFNKITFAVDDARYYKFANRSDLVRDNDNGYVWEFINTGDVSESEIEIFWAIANSTQTIVRFEGDEYYYDFTVSTEDKDAIREVLTAYEALK